MKRLNKLFMAGIHSNFYTELAAKFGMYRHDVVSAYDAFCRRLEQQRAQRRTSGGRAGRGAEEEEEEESGEEVGAVPDPSPPPMEQAPMDVLRIVEDDARLGRGHEPTLEKIFLLFKLLEVGADVQDDFVPAFVRMRRADIRAATAERLRLRQLRHRLGQWGWPVGTVPPDTTRDLPDGVLRWWVDVKKTREVGVFSSALFLRHFKAQ